MQLQDAFTYTSITYAGPTPLKSKKQLNEFSPKEAQDLIEKVLLPAMNEFNKSSKRDVVTGAPS